ncbi:AI-2E family transporter [Natronospira bacteriovora]|uniref:AI-2E family transporter n=1 Tax=Natronospira bacteriovora TaxID=3069753 RepID=A0ABU0W391_9GAMM|nr:AI-2E family transporter [Natronospira sp. AB-CW4]MDQ2068429.1 AI-2E family transporter [Natronospira sp. AB-CW4]
MEVVREWFQRHFSDPQVVILAGLLLAGFIGIIFAGQYLAPVLASLIIAYLLEGIIQPLQRIGVPRILAVGLVFIIFFIVLLAILFGLFPMLTRQATQLLQEVPAMLTEGQRLVLTLPERYPALFSETQIEEFLDQIRREAGRYTDTMLRQTLSSVVGVITLIVYIVLMPLLVFFFLKDKDAILNWARGHLPRQRGLATRVWQEVDAQLGNFVRGKFWEILIVWVVTYITFLFMGLNFAMLLGFLVGISVLIPYIGAAVMTFPVALVAYFQFGWSAELAWILVAYGIIQMLDGNVLVPILFSEVINLHPIAIIVAVLFFGGIWGFWGVFFAIPLAILAQAVLKAWPRQQETADEEPEAAGE